MAAPVGDPVRARSWLWFFLGMALAMLAGVATAAESCTNWRLPLSGTLMGFGANYNLSGVGAPFTGTNKTSVCTAFADAIAVRYGQVNGYTYRTKPGSVTVVSSGGNDYCWFEMERSSSGSWVSALTAGTPGRPYGNLGAIACPADPCDGYAGKKVTYAQQFAGGLPSVGGTTNYNIPVAGGCGAKRTAVSSCTENASGFFCFATYEYTGDPPTASPTTPGGSQADCAMIAGERNCGLQTNETTAQTCGTYNGERICYTSDPTQVPAGAAAEPPAGTCWTTGAGGLLCSSTAAVTDDTGAAVEPTQTIVTGNSTTNYYSPTTVTSTNATTVITGAGDLGSSTPGAEDDCDGLDCLEGGTMDGATEPGDAISGAMGRIEGAPIVAAISGLGSGFSGGTCPAWSSVINAEPFFTFTMDLTFICSMWESIAGVISAVMLAGWAILGFKVMASA